MEEIKFTEETIEDFLQEKIKSGNKPETIAEYRRILQKFQKELLPEDVLRENTLQQWKNTMQQEGKLAVRTINRRLAVVNQYLHFMGERNWQVSCMPLGDTEQTVLQRGKTAEKRAALFHHQVHLHIRSAYLGTAPNDSGFCKERQWDFQRQWAGKKGCHTTVIPAGIGGLLQTQQYGTWRHFPLPKRNKHSSHYHQRSHEAVVSDGRCGAGKGKS